MKFAEMPTNCRQVKNVGVRHQFLPSLSYAAYTAECWIRSCTNILKCFRPSLFINWTYLWLWVGLFKHSWLVLYLLRNFHSVCFLFFYPVCLRINGGRAPDSFVYSPCDPCQSVWNHIPFCTTVLGYSHYGYLILVGQYFQKLISIQYDIFENLYQCVDFILIFLKCLNWGHLFKKGAIQNTSLWEK